MPSVVYGLIGILAIAPFIGNHLISSSRRHSVSYVVQLNGANLTTAILILTIMIVPIMVAITANALAAVPLSWREGSAALGVNRWRTIWRVSLRTARPAIAAATVLSTARALGEAVMLAMVSGGRGFAANPLDGLDVLLRARAAAGGDDLPELRRADDPGRSRTRSTRWALCSWSPRRCSRSPAGRPSSSSGATGSGPDGQRKSSHPRPPTSRRAPRQSPSSWPLVDRCAYYLCWLVGIGLCVIAVAIVAVHVRQGHRLPAPRDAVRIARALARSRARAAGSWTRSSGTLIVGVLGTAIAAPVGVGIAAWLTEYGRPYWLARTVESSIEIMSGAPSVVLALFGLLIFAQSFLGFLSQTAANGSVYGRSFFAASAVMAVLAIPMVVGVDQGGPDAAARPPARGLLRARRAPASRRSAACCCPRSGRTSRPAPSWAWAGSSATRRSSGSCSASRSRLEAVGHVPVLGVLRGTGSTLTTYVYENSPAGEGTAPQKAYAAAFLLLLMILALNALVTWIANRGEQGRAAQARHRVHAAALLRGPEMTRPGGRMDPLMPPPRAADRAGPRPPRRSAAALGQRLGAACGRRAAPALARGRPSPTCRSA